MYRRKFLASSLGLVASALIAERRGKTAFADDTPIAGGATLSILENCCQASSTLAAMQSGQPFALADRMRRELTETCDLCTVAIQAIRHEQPVAAALWQSLSDACGRCRTFVPQSRHQAFDQVMALAERKILESDG